MSVGPASQAALAARFNVEQSTISRLMKAESRTWRNDAAASALQPH